MAPGYIIVWHPPASCGRTNSTTFTGQGDIPISSTGCTCFLIDGSVEGQYVTYIYKTYKKYYKNIQMYPNSWNGHIVSWTSGK